MSPDQIDNPNVDYRRLHELSEEFTQVWKRLQAFYLDAVAGFTFVRNNVESEQARARSNVSGSDFDTEEFQNTRMFTYSEIFAEDFCTSGIHRATQGEVKARNAPGGVNFTTLGQLCIVAFYDFWSDYLRREYVIAKGHLDRDEPKKEVVDERLKEHASHNLWGDIRYLRTSIVHKQGIAISDVAKCKLIKWFKPGDPIVVTPERMRAIFLGLLTYRNELFREQFPEHYIHLDTPPGTGEGRDPRSKIGILAFGSLIKDLGPELEPRIVKRIKTRTPFPVEYARISRKRGGAPTVIPHDSGCPVSAEILILDDAVSVEEAKDMLWRRETRKFGGEKYVEGTSPDCVLVREIADSACVSSLLFTDFPAEGKIGNLTAKDLAKRSIQSIGKADEDKDGITYLINAIASGIETPLTQRYRAEILKQTNADSLEEALIKAKKRGEG